ncbi:hypothetical protein GCM10009546_59910 [Actinomadura livida]|uniref:DUF3073 domain-containing protein n=2 Tax=Actinomadura livida TaxID=79909 RepID=A0ABN1FFA2_9ACTN|nr:hypothetical protein GCM10010208_60510 [Actinomadura livida]
MAHQAPVRVVHARLDGPTKALTIEGVEPMGRGRAKAKQVKVARQLKYNSGNTDLDRLKSELGVSDSGEDSYDELAEKYADFAEDYGTEDRKDGTSG